MEKNPFAASIGPHKATRHHGRPGVSNPQGRRWYEGFEEMSTCVNQDTAHWFKLLEYCMEPRAYVLRWGAGCWGLDDCAALAVVVCWADGSLKLAQEGYNWSPGRIPMMKAALEKQEADGWAETIRW